MYYYFLKWSFYGELGLLLRKFGDMSDLGVRKTGKPVLVYWIVKVSSEGIIRQPTILFVVNMKFYKI